jgi:hypothetical protein
MDWAGTGPTGWLVLKTQRVPADPADRHVPTGGQMAQFIGKHPAGPDLAARCGNRDAGCAIGHRSRRADGQEKSQ